MLLQKGKHTVQNWRLFLWDFLHPLDHTDVSRQAYGQSPLAEQLLGSVLGGYDLYWQVPSASQWLELDRDIWEKDTETDRFYVIASSWTGLYS